VPTYGEARPSDSKPPITITITITILPYTDQDERSEEEDSANITILCESLISFGNP